jgi:hypothetical protein
MAVIKIKLDVSHIDMDYKGLSETAKARLADFLGGAFGFGSVLTLELETNFQRVTVLPVTVEEK